METLAEYLTQTPLQSSRQILALTFMHGSRRRLNERMRQIRGLGTKYECSTIDSFAWRIVRRWQSLAAQLGLEAPGIADYQGICEVAATLLEHDVVVRWVAGTFPAVILDEAQDLTPTRLRIIRALSVRLAVFAAADEFQCLDEGLRPNPSCQWLAGANQVENLEFPRRTAVPALLEAARAIRVGEAPVSAAPFKIALTPKIALAGTFVANELGWYGGSRRVAIITPTIGAFASGVIDWVGANATTKGCGPYAINVEQSDHGVATELLSKLVLEDGASLLEAGLAARACGNPHVSHDVSRWLDVQRRARGRTDVTKAEVGDVIRQSLSARRRMHRDDAIGFRAMTVHGAKNREFENVIVLWPAAVMGSDDQRRRLLYNAITRATSRCLVLVQAQASMKQAPFA